MVAKAVEGRNVKSGSLGPAGHTEAADARERAKDFLTTAEVGRLLDATRAGRHGVRDHLLVLMMYRHGLRVSEAIALRRDEVDLAATRSTWPRRGRPGRLAAVGPAAQERAVGRAADGRRRIAGDEALSRHPRR